MSRVRSEFSEGTYRRCWRVAFDLPWHGVPVIPRVRARHFFCDEPSCKRPSEIAVQTRKTERFEEALLAIVFEFGVRDGARLA